MLASPASLVDESALKKRVSERCPIRDGIYQIVRNLLMIQRLEEDTPSGKRFRLFIVAPTCELNPLLHRAHADLLSDLQWILKPDRREAVQLVSFESVVVKAASMTDHQAICWSTYMTEKYILPLRAGVKSNADRVSADP